MLRKAIAAIIIFGSSTIYAYSGGDLLPLCKQAVKLADTKGQMTFSASDAADIGKCLGYVEGIIDFNVIFRAANFSGEVTYCPPAGTTAENDIRIIVKYLESNPKELQTPANIAAMHALRQAFPCKDLEKNLKPNS